MSAMNTSQVAFTSQARTATHNSDFKNYDGRGIRVVIDVTASADTPSVVFTLRGKTAAGTYYTLLASSAITGTGQTVLKVFPGAAVAANASANDAIPQVFNLLATHADADSISYSVSYDLLV